MAIVYQVVGTFYELQDILLLRHTYTHIYIYISFVIFAATYLFSHNLLAASPSQLVGYRVGNVKGSIKMFTETETDPR